MWGPDAQVALKIRIFSFSPKFLTAGVLESILKVAPMLERDDPYTINPMLQIGPQFWNSPCEFSQNSGYLFGGPYNKDYSISESILGFRYLGKLPCT